MTLFFDILTLESESKNDPKSMLTLLKQWLYKDNPYSKPIKKSLSGHSYLLNPKPLLYDTVTDPIYKVQYIKLAGRRDYTNYKLFKAKYLDLTLYPDINLSAIKSNPLITITNNKIYFKFEES